jgi:hypothetical protein
VQGTVLNQNLAGDVFKVDKYSLYQITVPGIFSDEFGNQQRKLNHFLMPDRLRKPRLSLYFSVISLHRHTINASGNANMPLSTAKSGVSDYQCMESNVCPFNA